MPFRLGKIGHTLQQKPNDRQEAYVRHREKDYKKKKKREVIKSGSLFDGYLYHILFFKMRLEKKRKTIKILRKGSIITYIPTWGSYFSDKIVK